MHNSSVLPSSRDNNRGSGEEVGTEGIEQERSHFWRLAGDSAALPRRLRVAGALEPPKRFASQVRNFLAVFFGQEPVEGAF